MNSQAQRQLRIANKKGIIVGTPETFEELKAAHEKVMDYNLGHLLMGINGKLSELGAHYISGEWVI